MNSPSRPLLDVRALPQTREIVAYHEGGLFGVLVAAPGGAIVAALRGGAGHLGAAGRIEIIRSLDGGRSWSPPNVIADSECDDRNIALGVAANGAILLAYHRQGSYDADGNLVYVPRNAGVDQPIDVLITRSFDAGLNWETPFPIELDARLRGGSPAARIVTQKDGTLLLPIYIYDHARVVQEKGAALDRARMLALGPDHFGSYLVRSHDNGVTWEDASLIAPAMDETALLEFPNGDLLAMLRNSGPEPALWSARSDDSGRTWTEPERMTAPNELPADLILLANGDVLLTYGCRNPPYRIEGRVSRDGGLTWLEDRLAFSGPLYGYDLSATGPVNLGYPAGEGSRRTDLGYPFNAVRRENDAGQGVTMYYYNPSIPQTGDWRTEGLASPLYSNRGYRAVAVTWDEQELIAAMERRISA